MQEFPINLYNRLIIIEIIFSILIKRIFYNIFKFFHQSIIKKLEHFNILRDRLIKKKKI